MDMYWEIMCFINMMFQDRRTVFYDNSEEISYFKASSNNADGIIE